MILDKEVEVKLNNRDMQHYIDLGYEMPRRFDKSRGRWATPRGSTIIVKVEHLKKSSNIRVNVECDYCGLKFQMIYQAYINKVENGEIKKVACKKCGNLKLQDTMISKYGTYNPMGIDDVRDKIKSKIKEKYGVEYASQNKDIANKISISKRKNVDLKEVFDTFNSRGLMVLIGPDQYEKSTQKIPFLCKNHLDKKIQYTTYNNLQAVKYSCKFCSYEATSKENHYYWNGGVSSLNQYLRERIYDWKKDSLKANGYECVITGNKMSDIHHLYSFNLIRDEALNNLNIPIKTQISEYTNEELESIVSECRNLHKQYGLGVPLSEEVHNLFHSIYGKGNNTPEQFEEFKIRYESGEFNDVLNKQ